LQVQVLVEAVGFIGPGKSRFCVYLSSLGVFPCSSTTGFGGTRLGKTNNERLFLTIPAAGALRVCQHTGLSTLRARVAAPPPGAVSLHSSGLCSPPLQFSSFSKTFEGSCLSLTALSEKVGCDFCFFAFFKPVFRINMASPPHSGSTARFFRNPA